MKSPLSALFAALAVTAVAASAAPSPPPVKLTKWQQAVQERFKNSAPADEYFGRMKMSFLGMNNTFRDSSISSGDHTTNPAIINKVTFAEDALEDWARKYPRDPQLARTYFLAEQVERKIWLKANQDRAWIYLNRVVQLFPDSYFGKTLKRDLAIGFTEHYYALPVPCATPSPSPTPSPAADAVTADQTMPGDSASANTPVPSPTPTPTPSPTPGPTETTISRGLRAQIIPQACVPAPTPSPSPSPSPSAAPSAAASDTPVPAVSPPPAAPQPT